MQTENRRTPLQMALTASEWFGISMLELGNRMGWKEYIVQHLSLLLLYIMLFL